MKDFWGKVFPVGAKGPPILFGPGEG